MSDHSLPPRLQEACSLHLIYIPSLVLHRLFSEQYVPWLNDLSPARLDREFASLAFYLELLDELPWKAVWRQIAAYLQAS